MNINSRQLIGCMCRLHVPAAQVSVLSDSTRRPEMIFGPRLGHGAKGPEGLEDDEHDSADVGGHKLQVERDRHMRPPKPHAHQAPRDQQPLRM